MGLDSYWVRPGTQDVVEVTFVPPLHLVGGMLSGHGSGSFRGKVYSELIEELTGQSLYQEEIPPDTVQAMSKALEDYDATLRSKDARDAFYQYWQVTAQEWADLRRMFNEYASQGCSLHGWW